MARGVCPRFENPPGAICPGRGGFNMHPGFVSWWRSHHSHEGRGRGCGPEARHGGEDEGMHASGAGDGDVGGFGAFGVRRPLRFLAYKLNLGEAQVNALARILNDLKTERAQAAVDNRRAVAALADAIAGDTFDDGKAKAAAADRVKSAERVRDAVISALGAIHALLQPGQREQLAYLIRTGALLI
jgi:Spy/CpxP family protein refolding chaperone